jgi:uroporphyrinogen decarboxylase
MTTPRELVYQTLEFNSPARVPHQLWALPWADEHYPVEIAEIRRRFPDDMIGAPGYLSKTPHTKGDPYQEGLYVDEWGCKFINIQRGVIGEVKEPLIQTWDDLDKLRTPDEYLTIDKDRINTFCQNTDRFVLSGCCPRPFERLQFIRRSDNLYIDLGEQSSELDELVRRMHHFFVKELELWAKTDVDGLTMMDDWGSQRGLLISPKTWRKYFKPLYKEYIDIAHSHGKKMFMHSDGYTAEIIPDLIELGLDAFNTQLFTMDIEELGRQYAGKLTFWGEIDRQHLLPYGTKDDIDKAVKRVNAAFNHHGGVIGQCEFGAGSKPENVFQVYQSWENIKCL